MRPIPKALEKAICEELGRRGMASDVQREWLKWLRDYLDFCGKYRHPQREEESLQLFLHKLAAKGQGEARQSQAAESIALFYEVVKRFPSPAQRRENPGDAGGGWEEAFAKLKGVIKVKQYSPWARKSWPDDAG